MIGKRVRIKRDLVVGESYGISEEIELLPLMGELRGREGEVTYYDKEDKIVQVKFDKEYFPFCNYFCWDTSMIEEV